MLKKFASGFLVKVCAAGCTFLFDLFIARYLGAKEAGYFFLAQAIIVILASIVRQGLDNAIVRYTASYRAQNQLHWIRSFTGFALLRVMLVGVITSIILFILAKPISVYLFDKPELSPTLTIFALILLPLTLTQIIGYFFQGYNKIILGMVYQSSLLAVISSISVLIFHPMSSLQAGILYLSITCLLCLVAMFHGYSRLRINFKGYPESERTKLDKTLKPLFVILVIGQVAQWIAPIILGVWLPSSVVALFAAALKTAKVTSFMLIVVNAVTAPRFAEAYSLHNIDELRRVAIKSGRLMMSVASILLCATLIFSPFIMKLFGEEFADGANILRILAIGQFVNAVTGAVGYLLQMTGNEVYLRNSMFVSISLLVILLFALVPFWGTYGAAIAVAVAMSTENLICAYQVKKVLGFNTLALWQKI